MEYFKRLKETLADFLIESLIQTTQVDAQEVPLPYAAFLCWAGHNPLVASNTESWANPLSLPPESYPINKMVSVVAPSSGYVIFCCADE